MAVISCDACSGKMNSGLAVCPHCGARRAVTERPKLSNDEIRALLATDPGLRGAEPPRGLLHTLVLPHPATSGGARIAELVLTALSLPLVLAGALSIGVTRRLARHKSTGGELVPALAMTVFGGLGLLGHVPLLAVGGSIAALWTRALIRWRAGTARGRDLMRIERPRRERSPALPAARAMRDEPAIAAKPGRPAAPPAVAPEEPPLPSGAEPRLLR